VDNKALVKQMKEWRQHLHAHPETAFEEENTADFVAEKLCEMGIEVHRGIGKTGVVGILKVGDSNKSIGLRADMDAINLSELSDLPYSSKNDGKMHACGHDGHVATLLGAAKLLAERRDFNGRVVFVFQPAEEPGYGAAAMIKDGILERFPMDEIYALHNSSGSPLGNFSTRTGGIMASEDNFVIKIKGKGGHASTPHMGIDPLVIAAEVILALQTIVSRNIRPVFPAVISCTEIYTDGARNAIPANVTIKGDTRSHTPEVQKIIEDRMRAVCEGICKTHGAECEFEYTHEFSPTLNWECCVKEAVEVAKALVGEENVNAYAEPSMGAEDFGAFTEKIPGCYLLLGTKPKDAKSIVPLHNSIFDFNDDALEIGVEFFARLVKHRLSSSLFFCQQQLASSIKI